MKHTQRAFGLDFIRVSAILSVIASHFFLHTGFQNYEFRGISMFLQAILKFFFGIGVPLFILLTGYLNCHKEATLKYYLGGKKVLSLYLFWSIVTCLYLVERSDVEIIKAIKGIISFSTIRYGWYIEMWIGLFLLIPFLNIMWQNCPTKSQKRLLLGILFVMTCIPNYTNQYGHLTPAYWRVCYPLFFYFSGAYIREYQPQMRKLWWYLIGGICLTAPTLNALFVSNSIFVQYTGEPNGIFGAIISIIFFVLCYKFDTKKQQVSWFFAIVSIASLEMYLCSYMFDVALYPKFQGILHWNDASSAGKYFLIVVPIIFTCALTAAFLRRECSKRLVRFAQALYSFRCKKSRRSSIR